MTELHPSELALSLYADDELDLNAMTTVKEHLVTCQACQDYVAASTVELSLIEASLKVERDLAAAIPPFKKPASLRGFAMANIATGLTIWLAQFLWKTIFGELFMNAASWLTSIYVPDVYEVVTTTGLYYLQEGTAMFDAYLGLIILTLVTITALSLLMSYRKARSTGTLCLALLVGGSVLAPQDAYALDIRRADSVVTVAATETIEDTLITAGDLIRIDGDITGDLIAAGRNIEVNGDVAGNVFAFGESIVITGSVGGMLVSAGSTIDISAPQVGGDVWTAGDKINLDKATQVGRNLTTAGQRAVVAGSVTQDLHAFTETLELNGTVKGKLEAYANRIRLLDQAHILGNANLHTGGEDALHRAPGAKIDGSLEFLDLPEDLGPTNPYATLAFYLWQIARLLTALLVGLALLWLVPKLRDVDVAGGMEGLKSAGIGLITLVSLPIIAALVAITLVGIPFAFAGIVAWIALFYLAKIVVALFIGRNMLSGSARSESNFMVLLTGLVVVIVAINLPYIGGIISFILTIVGAGLLVQHVLAALPGKDADGPSVA